MTALTLIKIGGKVLDDPALLAPVLNAFVARKGPKILVHGGGKAGTDLARLLNIEAPLVAGRRITSPEMLEVALMVYGGTMNRKLVAALQARGLDALGLTGADLNLIRARKRPVEDLDYGLVGDIEAVNVRQLGNLLNANLVPVLAPLTHDGQGQLLNTNADTIAATVAVALAPYYAVELIFAFERPGVLADAQDDGSLLPHLSRADAERHQAAGVIAAGMLPKLKNAFIALEAGVSRVLIGRAEGGRFTGTTIELD